MQYCRSPVMNSYQVSILQPMGKRPAANHSARKNGCNWEFVKTLKCFEWERENGIRIHSFVLDLCFNHGG